MTVAPRCLLAAGTVVIADTVENLGGQPTPHMLLYHFNYGFPLLAPGARIVAPIRATTPRTEEARRDRGVEECCEIGEPLAGYQEKVFFHDLAAGRDGRTFVALLNPDPGDGEPLGVVLRFDKRQLPAFTQWKMPRRGFYVLGLEPGTTPPLNRGVLRERGQLPTLAAQSRYTVQIDLEVLDSAGNFRVRLQTPEAVREEKVGAMILAPELSLAPGEAAAIRPLLTPQESAALAREARRPFNLESGPVMRLSAFRRGPEEQVAVFGPVLKARLAGRNNRHLRHGKNPIQQDQDQENNKLDHRNTYSPLPPKTPAITSPASFWSSTDSPSLVLRERQ